MGRVVSMVRTKITTASPALTARKLGWVIHHGGHIHPQRKSPSLIPAISFSHRTGLFAFQKTGQCVWDPCSRLHRVPSEHRTRQTSCETTTHSLLDRYRVSRGKTSVAVDRDLGIQRAEATLEVGQREVGVYVERQSHNVAC